jgi:hypothetical protein
MIDTSKWVPLACTSACSALISFGEEFNKAMQKTPSQNDLDATFNVQVLSPRCS